MFEWTEERVSFMADACERTDFHEKLAALLSPYLKRTDSVCDAGCGLGYLSLALSPLVGHVTAAERDDRALDVLRRQLVRRHIRNVTPLCTDVLAYTPSEPFDAMVFCFFGSMEEIVAAASAGERCWPSSGTTRATGFPVLPVSRDATASRAPAAIWSGRASPTPAAAWRWTFPSLSARGRTRSASWRCTAGKTRRKRCPHHLFPPAIRNFRGSCPVSGALD